MKINRSEDFAFTRYYVEPGKESIYLDAEDRNEIFHNAQRIFGLENPLSTAEGREYFDSEVLNKFNELKAKNPDLKPSRRIPVFQYRYVMPLKDGDEVLVNTEDTFILQKPDGHIELYIFENNEVKGPSELSAEQADTIISQLDPDNFESIV